MKRGHIPKRTCISCSGKASKKELIRYVCMNGKVIEDIDRRLPGRGIYCCANSACLKRFSKRTNKLEKVFRLQGDKSRDGSSR